MAERVEESAPGRVNLIGEHTDYNEGFVLPMGLPLRTTVAIERRNSGDVEIESDARGHASYRLGEEQRTGEWVDYVAGTTWLLRERGTTLGPMRVRVTTEVPLGSGLSSSASLLVAFLRALRRAFELSLDDLTIARLAQEVENRFVGARVGIMDPMAVSLAAPGSALFIDTRSLTFERIAIPDTMAFVVIDSGVAHRLSGGGYNQRRAECEEAARLLGVASLRDVAADASLDAVPEVLRRRVRHVVSENARVLEAREAIQQADAPRLGQLFSLSHASLRDDYEVSVPEVDRLVELAEAEPEIHGARITGGGFGGAIVAVSRPESGDVGARIAARYERETQRHADVLLPPARG
jgi:galactokinase